MNIITITAPDLFHLQQAVNEAVAEQQSLRVDTGGGVLSVKVGEGMWSEPLGEVVA